MDVVKQDGHRAGAGQELEKRPHATRDAVPAVSPGGFDPGHPSDRRQHGSKVGQVLHIEPAGWVSRQPSVERVD
jgi:hypothetical protein